MMAIFIATLCFTVHNIIVFLIRQKRYRNWLVTVFYIFSILVLVTRILQYIFAFNLNHLIREAGISGTKFD